MSKVRTYFRILWMAIKNDRSYVKQLIDTIDYLVEELHKAESKLIKKDSAKGKKK